MQNYVPLVRGFNLVAIGSRQINYDTKSIGLPVRRLWTPSSLLSRLGRLGNLRVTRRLNSDRLLGLEKLVVNADIVHSAETFNVYSHQVSRLKKKHGFKLVLTVWENIPFLFDGAAGNSERIHQRKLAVITAADHFIAISQRSKEAMMLEGVPKEKITVRPMGININKFTPQKKDMRLLKQFELASSDLVILFVGQLSGNKGERELVFAAAKLKQAGLVEKYQTKFVVIGQGGFEEDLRMLIDRAGVADIFRLIPRVPYKDMPKVHNLADIFYLGSVPVPVWQEQFGMVLIESMACGKPVVAAESGSISEVVGDAGVLFPAADFCRLSEEFRRLIEDSARREELGRKGRKRVEDLFDSRKVARKIGEIYQDVLGP